MLFKTMNIGPEKEQAAKKEKKEKVFDSGFKPIQKVIEEDTVEDADTKEEQKKDLVTVSNSELNKASPENTPFASVVNTP